MGRRGVVHASLRDAASSRWPRFSGLGLGGHLASGPRYSWGNLPRPRHVPDGRGGGPPASEVATRGHSGSDAGNGQADGDSEGADARRHPFAAGDGVRGAAVFCKKGRLV